MKKIKPIMIALALPFVVMTQLLAQVDLHPDGDGVFLDWTPISGGGHYVEVDDQGDGDTTYVSQTSVNSVDSYTLEDLTGQIPPGAIITSVEIVASARKTSGTKSIKLGGDSSGTLFSGGVHTLSSSYQGFKSTFTTDPNTGTSWTITGVDALKIGIKSVSAWSGGGEARLTAIGLRVNCILCGALNNQDIEVDFLNHRNKLFVVENQLLVYRQED